MPTQMKTEVDALYGDPAPSFGIVKFPLKIAGNLLR